ncbi:hypothetical protein GE061_016537 [Apolygus lucorum]|uniref:Uncharacterized protein n=1 Tax=Apolygus lucorum TaxID=248454 RepID=A0A8S9XGK9_APOLU|nr:hypothetical protein GE061_016537 [Apolygus lucorum]
MERASLGEGHEMELNEEEQTIIQTTLTDQIEFEFVFFSPRFPTRALRPPLSSLCHDNRANDNFLKIEDRKSTSF